MKKAFSIIGLIIVLIIPLFGCSESGPSAPADPVVTKSQMDAAIKVISDGLNNANMRMDGISSKSSAAPDLSGYYTKPQVDQAIADAIKKLKDDQTWVTTVKPVITPNKPTTHDSDDEDVLASTSDLVLSLEKSVEDDFYLGDSELSPYMKLTITNNDTSSHTFRLKADFDCDDTVKMDAATLSADYSYSSSAVMILDGTLGAVDTSTVGFTSRRQSASTDSTWYIGKSRSESIYLRFTPDYNPATTGSHTWTWSYTLKQVD